ncbi:MAG TPA: response regulator [Terriglobales bacterium]|jgi:two-component system chemotaxis sensor kinase CheA
MTSQDEKKDKLRGRLRDKDREDELLKKLLVTFRAEAGEHVQALSTGLIELERASLDERGEIVEKVFREAHSLKGAARAVNAAAIEAECQELESILARLKAGDITVSTELLDQLHHRVDSVEARLAAGSAAAVESTVADDKSRTGQLPVSSATAPESPPSFRASNSVESVVAPRVSTDQKQALSETLRISAEKLDSLLRQSEELLPLKTSAQLRARELREICNALSLWEGQWRKLCSSGPFSVSAIAAREGEAPAASKPADFMERNKTTLALLNQRLAGFVKLLESDRRALERRVDDLVEDAKQLSMIPVSTLLESFPKLVRDLCRDCRKEADLVITGGELETDRKILEEVKDALLHLLRNCIDHGVETPEKREQIGKPRRATIRITVSPRNADKVEIVISDDGAGIDLEKACAAAVRLGLVTAEEAEKMDEQQSAALIFKSGISTSPTITEVSGRGLGLAIVREKAEKVGGSVAVTTRRGEGTSFRLLLPLTFARFRGIVVRVGDAHFVLPTRHVERVLRVPEADIKSVENRKTIQLPEGPLSAVHLGDVLRLPSSGNHCSAQGKYSVAVLTWSGVQIGFFVDEILEEQEVLVKSMGKQLSHVRNIAGATVLGDGKVLPVLNIQELMSSAVIMAPASDPQHEEEAAKSVLVAEDSITARTLVKNILEFAGYRVKTAVDGADAWNTLAQEGFDLVVSDVEMPRMSGFDLTAKIRANQRTARLPVILVTALDSRYDRERGVDVGANAYVVKSSFDQGNLLEVVRRLI